MSTDPTAGRADAGLEPPTPGEPVDLLQDPGIPPGDPEEYSPTIARPDTDGAATESDVADQAVEVPLDDDAEGTNVD
ncbi:hypothetical protein [Sanguibacter sp. HDW7]|uniref:hypothetical protein n=1 Tax=Sanguibacter sp. HDW7 TaxID=2714931 RepID=UPI0014074862|nr:hypothetical protein [Sanguibacter sp. HDW7]QIK82937.1 hypothetical protein G7063_04325 [Sanguibacter sp. HDW7]